MVKPNSKIPFANETASLRHVCLKKAHVLLRKAQAHPVLQRESGVSVLGILALVPVRLVGARCEPALPVNESTQMGDH
jgi:hypothetical protein